MATRRKPNPLTLRVTDALRARLREVAEEDGVTVGTFIRRCIQGELEVREALRLEQERYEREGR